MKDCKQTLLAPIEVDNAARQHLSGSEVPTKLQAAATGLGDALKTLNAAQLAIIRNYIDKDAIPGFEGSGGTGARSTRRSSPPSPPSTRCSCRRAAAERLTEGFARARSLRRLVSRPPAL
jgi:hypothetical protein